MEDGLISGIIAEVVKGMSAGQSIVEEKAPRPDPAFERMQRNAFTETQAVKLQEHRSKLMSAIGGEGFNGVNLFEGTTPTPSEMSPTQQSSPLAGHAPTDAGIDIDNLFGTVAVNWNAHMTEMKNGK